MSERTHICGGCGSREDVGYVVDGAIAALQAEVKDLKEWLSAYKQSLELAQSSLTQRTAEFQRHDGELQQICGQALGYPWFKDDQKNFPGATEKDGVCVGEHVGITIAQELANAYRKRTTELEAAKQNLERRTDECNEISKMYVEAQAELERVRGQYAELGKMVLALPKVEGEIYEVVASYRYDKVPEAWFHCELPLSALLQHRQGMEG